MRDEPTVEECAERVCKSYDDVRGQRVLDEAEQEEEGDEYD